MSKPTKITIDDIEYVRADSIKPEVAEVEGTPIGLYCIVRCRDAGVWAGIVADKSGRDATLVEARRLYYWKAKKGHTLSAVAIHGISDGKLPQPVDLVFLTETCEFIPASKESEKTIRDMGVHNE